MKKNRGVALIEVIIGAAIMTAGLLAVNSSFTAYVQYALANEKNVESSHLMEEGLEVAAFMRDSGWANNISKLSTTTTYYLTFNGTKWATTTTPQYVDGSFLRSMNVYDVKRDANSDISAVGTYDPDIKKITITVSYWQGHGTTTEATSEYLANLK